VRTWYQAAHLNVVLLYSAVFKAVMRAIQLRCV
jgi:hypothetical protein